ncbi:tripeptidyl-peptidase 1 [Apiospora aurea]|uniref:Tripeptidyl-peptidase 1 n=1 Tax=Apiospora aurea TaxID=335848 RepID=A0ABR1PYZ1_9PEZI
MKLLPVIAPVASLTLLLSLAIAANADFTVEPLSKIPVGWEKVREAEPAETIRLRIALEQPNLDAFEQILYDVSTPQHPLYGRHLSRDELAKMTKPREESTDAVLTWLQLSGIPASDVENTGEWVNFRTTVGKAQSSKHYVCRLQSYWDRYQDAPHVAPTTRSGRIRSQRSMMLTKERYEQLPVKAAEIPNLHLNAASCNITASPKCLRALYRIGNHTSDPSVPSAIGIAGFLEEWAKFDALGQFLAQFATYATTQNFSYVLVNNGQDNQTDQTQDSVEANLDVQYVAALGYNTDIRFYSTGGRGLLVPGLDSPDPNSIQNEPYLDLVTYLLSLSDENLPKTITFSYGENEQTVPKEYARKVCTMFGQLGARGVSVIFSSGDSGPGSDCLTNDGKNTTRFDPIFPATCPCVTSVGGTYGAGPERAVAFSSGGFRDLWPMPAYQNASVAGYLQKLGSQWEGLYNQSGRGFPDVAAQAHNVPIVSQGYVEIVGGTSAAAPTFAAVVSLLNNARIKNGMAPMGFLNPWLYSVGLEGGAWTDITAGGSVGCTGTSISSGFPTAYVPGASWNATGGWDPVTGLGTPLFDTLLELAVPRYTLPPLG